MRIPLLVDEDGIKLSVRIVGKRVNGAIDFVVDTGSEHTFIGSIDAEKLGIFVRRLTYENHTYWGDEKFRLAKLRRPELWVKSVKEDGSEHLHIIRSSFVEVTPDKVHTKEGIFSPNLLGLDFMRKHMLRLIFDAKKNEAWFEL